MNDTLSITSTALEAQFGRRLAARLEHGSNPLPNDISERLRVARQQAVSQRKLAPQFHSAPVVVSNRGGSAALGGGWWTRIGAVVPLIALVAGLITISVIQEDDRANELADVDSALLTGDLPTAAYTDPGFAQFLKNSDKSAEH